MIYRIITENKNLKKVEVIVNKYFDKWTLIRGLGYCRGIAEQCMIIEITDTEGDVCHTVNSIAIQIKEINDQESVLVQRVREDHIFV